MKKMLLSTLLALFGVLLIGCSEEEAQKEETPIEEKVDEEEAKEADAAVEPAKAEEPAVEEPTEVSEEDVNAYFAEYADLKNTGKGLKKIGENTYQTMDIGELGEEVDTYTTWKFTPGEPEPEKVFEKTFERNAEGAGFPRYSHDVAKAFRMYDEFFVIEPLVSLDAETVAAIKEGHFPFSDLRIGMTKEEAAKIHPNPYFVFEGENATWLYGREITYSVAKDTGLVAHVQASSEAFADHETPEEIKTLFGKPIEEGALDNNTVYYSDFASGNYVISIIGKNEDKEWNALQIAVKK